jgi:hypothetical protein
MSAAYQRGNSRSRGSAGITSHLKTVAFVFGLCISAVGVVGILAPSGLVWLAEQFDTPGAFYVLATSMPALGA